MTTLMKNLLALGTTGVMVVGGVSVPGCGGSYDDATSLQQRMKDDPSNKFDEDDGNRTPVAGDENGPTTPPPSPPVVSERAALSLLPECPEGAAEVEAVLTCEGEEPQVLRVACQSDDAFGTYADVYFSDVPADTPCAVDFTVFDADGNVAWWCVAEDGETFTLDDSVTTLFESNIPCYDEPPHRRAAANFYLDFTTCYFNALIAPDFPASKYAGPCETKPIVLRYEVNNELPVETAISVTNPVEVDFVGLAQVNENTWEFTCFHRGSGSSGAVWLTAELIQLGHTVHTWTFAVHCGGLDEFAVCDGVPSDEADDDDEDAGGAGDDFEDGGSDADFGDDDGSDGEFDDDDHDGGGDDEEDDDSDADDGDEDEDGDDDAGRSGPCPCEP